MNLWNILSIVLWITSLIHSSDGKGGGGNDDKEEVNPVVIVAIGTAEVGTDVTLECQFGDVAKPKSLYWFQGNDIVYGFQDNLEYKDSAFEVINNKFNVTKVHSIIMKDIDLQHDAVYKCLVITENGEELEGQLPLVVAPHTKIVKSLETVLLDCHHYKGDALPLWQKDKEIVVFNSPKYSRYSLIEKDIQIVNVTESDEGVYTCYNKGKRADATTLIFYRDEVAVTPELSSLHGWRGLVFGGMLGVLIVLILAITCYMQHKPVAMAK